jgi:hypothetical protein
MYRAYGSIPKEPTVSTKINRGVASDNIVTTDFNPSTGKQKRLRAVGSLHII